jgi:hypothetical protein
MAGDNHRAGLSGGARKSWFLSTSAHAQILRRWFMGGTAIQHGGMPPHVEAQLPTLRYSFPNLGVCRASDKGYVAACCEVSSFLLSVT